MFEYKSSQIRIRRVVRLPLSGKTMHPRVPPRLWRSSRSMPGSPRSESPIVDCLEGLQRNASSLRNIWQRLNTWIPFPELLGVGGSLRLSSFVCSKLGVIFFEHLLVTSFNLLESPKPPEVFEGCIDLTFCSTQFPNFSSNLSISEGHLTLH